MAVIVCARWVLQSQLDGAIAARREQLLRNDVRRNLRSADTEQLAVNLTDRWIQTKCKFDRLFKVNCEIDIASWTVNLRSDFLQRVHSRTAATHRANQIPLQIQHPGAGRGQTSFQHGATRLSP